jgi:hypothetical protein
LPAVLEETTQNTFRKLSLLLRRDLDFGSHDSTYASHAIHPFAAKFPPQIPHLFIDQLTESGDSILDPMAGSGTTIVEALILRREAFGFDIDPLAVRLCTVKTKWLDPHELERGGIEIIQKAKRILNARVDLRRKPGDQPCDLFTEVRGGSNEARAGVLGRDGEQDVSLLQGESEIKA